MGDAEALARRKQEDADRAGQAAEKLKAAASNPKNIAEQKAKKRLTKRALNRALEDMEDDNE